MLPVSDHNALAAKFAGAPCAASGLGAYEGANPQCAARRSSRVAVVYGEAACCTSSWSVHTGLRNYAGHPPANSQRQHPPPAVGKLLLPPHPHPIPTPPHHSIPSFLTSARRNLRRQPSALSLETLTLRRPLASPRSRSPSQERATPRAPKGRIPRSPPLLSKVASALGGAWGGREEGRSVG